MNKTNFIFSTIASFAIVAASMPLVALSSAPVSAATTCIDISDDFSSDSGMWDLFTPESSINAGVLTLVASDNQELGDPNLTYSDATLVDSTTGDNVALLGDWEMSYETLLKSTPTATPDAEMFWWGGELYTLETGTTNLDNLYANYAGYETGSTFRFADTLNATKTGFDSLVSEAASFDPYTDTVTITYKKEGSLLSGEISFDGVTFYEQGTNVDIGEPLFFRFTSQNYLSDSNLETEVEFDNFSVKCTAAYNPVQGPCLTYSDDFGADLFAVWNKNSGQIGIVDDKLDFKGTYSTEYSEINLGDPNNASDTVYVDGPFTTTVDVANMYTVEEAGYPSVAVTTGGIKLYSKNAQGSIQESFIIKVTYEINDAFKSGRVIQAQVGDGLTHKISIPDFSFSQGSIKLKIVNDTENNLSFYYSIDNGGSYAPILENYQRSFQDAKIQLALFGGSYGLYQKEVGYTQLDNFTLSCANGGTPIDPGYTNNEIDTTTPFNVQRFFNIRIGSAHFYSIDPTEAQFVEDNSKAGGLWPGAFVKEDPTFAAFNYDSVNDKCMDGTSPVYRYLNRTTGDTHFYAIKADEISAVEGQFASTFKPEGVSFCAYLTEATGSIPVLRWQNTLLGSTHFYSGSETERDVVDTQLSDMFRYEGIAFYGMPVL